jgi:glc operon protein GlcG
MEHPETAGLITALIANVAKLVPQYLELEEERKKARGGIAICVIDPEGNVYGKMFGEDKIVARERYRNAWIKASQVWITGIRTGEFERLVYTGEIDEAAFGIKKPEYIGWEGGQPVQLPNGVILAAGFAGLRGATDLEIVVRALEMLS